MKKRSFNAESLTTLQAILLGALLAAVAYLAATFAMSIISFGTADPTSLIGPLSLTALLVSGAVSALIITRVCGERGVLIALLSSLLLALVLLICGLVASGGSLPIRCPVNYLCYVGISVLTAFIGKKRSTRRRRR